MRASPTSHACRNGDAASPSLRPPARSLDHDQGQATGPATGWSDGSRHSDDPLVGRDRAAAARTRWRRRPPRSAAARKYADGIGEEPPSAMAVTGRCGEGQRPDSDAAPTDAPPRRAERRRITDGAPGRLTSAIGGFSRSGRSRKGPMSMTSEHPPIRIIEPTGSYVAVPAHRAGRDRPSASLRLDRPRRRDRLAFVLIASERRSGRVCSSWPRCTWPSGSSRRASSSGRVAAAGITNSTSGPPMRSTMGGAGGGSTPFTLAHRPVRVIADRRRGRRPAAV
jgi:hypothetical protein